MVKYTAWSASLPSGLNEWSLFREATDKRYEVGIWYIFFQEFWLEMIELSEL